MLKKHWLIAVAVATSIVLAWAIFAPLPAQAQQCAPLDRIVSELAAQYGEKATGVGVSTRGHMVSIFVNPTTRTWTIVAVLPDGSGCIVDVGDGFQKPTDTFMPSLLHGTRI